MQVMLDLWFLLYFVIIKSKTFNSSLEWPIILVIISNKPLVNTVLHGIAVNMIIYPLPKFASQFTRTLHKHKHTVQFIWIIVMIDIWLLGRYYFCVFHSSLLNLHTSVQNHWLPHQSIKVYTYIIFVLKTLDRLCLV